MFYDNLARICAEKGRTVSAVGRSVGIPNSTITYWRQGNLPTLETIYKLAEALGIPPAELVPEK